MTNSLSTLHAVLRRQQQSGDLAAQAETLMALGQLADSEWESSLAQGLYSQAWSTYEQVRDTSGQVKALWSMAQAMADEFWSRGVERLPRIFDWRHIQPFNEQALALSETIADLRTRAETYMFMHQVSTRRHTGSRSFSTLVLQKALHCYELLDSMPEQAVIVRILSEHISILKPEYGPTKEKLLALYRRLNDPSGEAHTLAALGDHKGRMKDPTTAREYLNAAIQRFDELGEYRWMVSTIQGLNIMTLCQMGYDTFRQTQLQSIAHIFQNPTARPFILPLWIVLAHTARKHHDFETARTAFQQALSGAVSAGQPQKQGELYWQWGYMEYIEAQRHSMGFALCQWGFTLIRVFDPKSTEHQRQFRALCYKMKATFPRPKRHKP